MRVLRGGGTEEPGEPSAKQEQRAGATEQWKEQRPCAADTTGKHTENTNAAHVVAMH